MSDWVGRGAMLVAGLFFVYATVVQFNDIDAAAWIALYASAAGVAFVGAAQRPHVVVRRLGPLSVLLAVTSFVWAAVLAPQALTEASFSASEVSREFGGLAIVGIFAILSALRARAHTSV